MSRKKKGHSKPSPAAPGPSVSTSSTPMAELRKKFEEKINTDDDIMCKIRIVKRSLLESDSRPSTSSLSTVNRLKRVPIDPEFIADCLQRPHRIDTESPVPFLYHIEDLVQRQKDNRSCEIMIRTAIITLNEAIMSMEILKYEIKARRAIEGGDALAVEVEKLGEAIEMNKKKKKGHFKELAKFDELVRANEKCRQQYRGFLNQFLERDEHDATEKAEFKRCLAALEEFPEDNDLKRDLEDHEELLAHFQAGLKECNVPHTCRIEVCDGEQGEAPNSLFDVVAGVRRKKEELEAANQDVQENSFANSSEATTSQSKDDTEQTGNMVLDSKELLVKTFVNPAASLLDELRRKADLRKMIRSEVEKIQLESQVRIAEKQEKIAEIDDMIDNFEQRLQLVAPFSQYSASYATQESQLRELIEGAKKMRVECVEVLEKEQRFEIRAGGLGTRTEAATSLGMALAEFQEP